jgi:membrane protease YdiL (CAAX protease family)
MKNLLNEIELELLHTPETTFLGKLKNVIFGAAAYIIWATFILFIYKTFIPEYNGIKLQFWPIEHSTIYLFISSCIFAPFVEELFFRKPLDLVKHISISRVMIYYVIISSVIFGYIHRGVWSIPVQGVAGLIFCYVYLKNGYSYFSSVAMHFLINFYYFIK